MKYIEITYKKNGQFGCFSINKEIRVGKNLTKTIELYCSFNENCLPSYLKKIKKVRRVYMS